MDLNFVKADYANSIRCQMDHVASGKAAYLCKYDKTVTYPAAPPAVEEWIETLDQEDPQATVSNLNAHIKVLEQARATLISVRNSIQGLLCYEFHRRTVRFVKGAVEITYGSYNGEKHLEYLTNDDTIADIAGERFTAYRTGPVPQLVVINTPDGRKLIVRNQPLINQWAKLGDKVMATSTADGATILI